MTGDDFTPGAAVTVQLTDPDGDPVGDAVTVTTDGDGSITTPLTVPDDAAAGGYTVVVTDPTTGVAVEEPRQVVAPSVTVDPGTVPAGGTTTVDGDGLAPGGDVTVVVTSPDGDVVLEATVPADGDGSVSVDVPLPADATPGEYTVVVVDETTDASVEAPLAVTPAPTIEVTPPTVEPGDTVDVGGDGFTPGAVESKWLPSTAPSPVSVTSAYRNPQSRIRSSWWSSVVKGSTSAKQPMVMANGISSSSRRAHGGRVVPRR